MVQVSAGDSSHKGARVQGVVRISDDGSRVYFVAQGVLTSQPGPEGMTAQNGADNLYVSENGMTSFIGELCSAHNTSGSLSDTHCPGGGDNLWGGRDEHPAWAAPFGSASADGRFLVFASSAQLITTGSEADTDTATDVYRYDSQTKTLRRISVGRNGADDNGNNNEFPATIGTPNYSYQAAPDTNATVGQGGGGRPVSNDGSFVFFTTSEALQPDDANHAPDVYEWHEGLVSLISDGQDPGTSVGTENDTNSFLAASVDGRDVFFSTPDTLVAEGGSNPQTIYDARIGGGFPQAIVPPPCREDACQGTISPSPSFPSPSSALYNSGGNVGAPISEPGAKPKSKLKARPKKRKVSRHKKHKAFKAARRFKAGKSAGKGGK
jgi:hypothetical protein